MAMWHSKSWLQRLCLKPVVGAPGAALGGAGAARAAPARDDAAAADAAGRRGGARKQHRPQPVLLLAPPLQARQPRAGCARLLFKLMLPHAPLLLLAMPCSDFTVHA